VKHQLSIAGMASALWIFMCEREGCDLCILACCPQFRDMVALKARLSETWCPCCSTRDYGA